MTVADETMPQELVKVLAAGSLRAAMTDIIRTFTESTGTVVIADFGPAGFLRERIEAGEAFDLFASANMEHPHRLLKAGLASEVVRFARNRLCVVARKDLGLTPENFVTIATDPTVRLGTSTPVVDPSGDYALEVFRRVEARHPGLGRVLEAKALQLVGGRVPTPVPAGKPGAGWLIAAGKADMFLTYESNGRLSSDDPMLTIVSLPEDLSPIVEYGLAPRSGAGEAALRLRDFILSEPGQLLLIHHGFRPN